MDFSLPQSLLRLGLLDTAILTVGGSFILYSGLTDRKHILLMILILSAASVGSRIHGVEGLASVGRLVALVLLLAGAIVRGRLRPSPGVILFWGYVAFGVISLLQAINSEWQAQRCILLGILAVTIPFAFGDKNYTTLKASLIAIAIAGAAFSLFHFTALPSQLGKASRFSGYLKGAASYAMVLGGFLPFMLWGTWRAGHPSLRMISGVGFLLGAISLVLSGQRTGTVAGLIGILPLLFILLRRKTILLAILLVALPVFTSYQMVQQGGRDRGTFLLDRYSASSDLSGRPTIWKRALSEIAKQPLIGRGIGASENVIKNSFHNTYLEVWFNSGIFGLFLFLAAQVFFLFRAFLLVRRSETLEAKSLGALALGYMMGFIVISFFESAGAGASNLNLILYLLLGVIASNKALVAEALPEIANSCVGIGEFSSMSGSESC